MNLKQTVVTRAMIVGVVLAGMAGLAQSETPAAVDPDVEVQVRILQFDRKHIEAISRTNTIDKYVVMSLFSAGAGELVAAPIVRTRPGTEASWRGVVEYVYPTSFETQSKDLSQAGTNDTSAAEAKRPHSGVAEECVVPQDFATREVGAILTVKPELDAAKRTVRVTITPQCVFQPTWRGYGYKNAPTNQPAPMEEPFFPVLSLNADITMSSGSTALIGGGTPNFDGTKMFYAVATVRLLDADGRPVAK